MKIEFQVGFCTDIGRKRSQNQDNGGAHPELGLFLVADGMGGHKGGEAASALVAETVPSVIREMRTSGQGGTHLAEDLSHAIQIANAKIFLESEKDPTLQGMGTTTTALLFSEKQLTIGQVGDSRCYFVMPHHIWQLTRDHSLVQEKLRSGLITREQTRTDKMKNVITRSVGFEPKVEVETYQMNIQPRDCFLICSDGLSSLLEDSEILEVVEKYFFKKGDAQQTVKELVAAANNHGGDDNITVILVQVK